VRVPSLPVLPQGSQAVLAISGIDLIDNVFQCEFVRRADANAPSATAQE
jgi:hypothetical protein